MLNEPGWHETYRNDQWYSRFKKRFYHRFAYRFTDPEDAFAQSIETLLFRKLPASKPSNMRNIDSFVNVIFDRTVIDRCRSENGRLFVPVKLKSKGPVHTELFYRHCLGRLSAEEISRQIDLSLDCVHHWIAWIELKRACERPRLKVSDTDVDNLDSSGPGDVFQSPIEQELEVAERRAMVSELLFGGEDKKLEKNTKLPTISLSADQILVLKMRYWEEMTLEAIAEELHIKVHRIKYIHATAIKHLRQIINEYSLDVHL
jgi:RNA polymerase sigma factor (sigma-70 family)